MVNINIKVDQKLYEDAKKILDGYGVSVEEVIARFLEHMAADKERILKNFHSGISAEKLVKQAADDVLENVMICKN